MSPHVEERALVFGVPQPTAALSCRGSVMQFFRSGVIGALLIGLAADVVTSLPVRLFASEPETLPAGLRAALEAEASGQVALRQTLLEQALAAEPESKPAHWHSGQVRLGKNWVNLDEYSKQAQTKPALAQYRELRGKSEPTLESQLQLADFCKRHQLREQERAHLTAVLELESNHADARRRLNHQLIDGHWRTQTEVVAARRQTKEVALATQKYQGTLVGLGQKLRDQKISSEEALQVLSDMRDPAVIPAWEVSVSTPSAEGGLVVVKTLKEMPQAEASLSLARHALYTRWPEVELSAVDALRGRDEFSYIPELLSMLQSRWLSTMELLRAPDGRLLYRHLYFADGQEKQQLLGFDQVFFLRGFMPSAASQAASAGNRTNQLLEQRRAMANAAIEQQNQRIGYLLRLITGEAQADSPESWWQWWNDRNGIYVQGDKPLEQSYAFAYATVVGAEPQPSFGRSTPTSIRSPGSLVQKDCLAGGTPVWTESGPVAVDRLKIGDLVLSQNPATGELSFRAVLRTTVRAPEPLLQVKTDSDTIRTSGGHPFWVSGKGWLRARDLEPGMVLHGAESPAIVRELVAEEKSSRSFNLIVDELHAYFAGNSKVLTHDNSVRKPAECSVPGLLP